jgi:uncharacterized protein (TIGR00251 family)
MAWQGRDLLLRVQVQPRASSDGFAGVMGDALRVRVAAPPADGRANSRLLEFLAGAFDVPRSRVELLAGHGGRRKRIRIHAPGPLPAELGILAGPDYKSGAGAGGAKSPQGA